MYVLDTGAFILDKIPSEKCITVEGVVKEAKNRIVLSGVEVRIPKQGAVDKVIAESKATGDIHKLSDTDIQVLALALSEKATLLTDDYSMQNVAEELGVSWMPLSEQGIKDKIKWGLRCRGCKRWMDKSPCIYCGHDGYRAVKSKERK